MFEVGSRVVVLPLGRKQGVVVEAGRGGHYRVQVENTTVSCREDDLAEPVPPKRQREGGEPRRKKHARPQPPHVATPVADATMAAAPTIDLHGLTVEAALARVIEAIDMALRRGADCLEVVHGKGSGRIRNVLHHHLKTMTVVASFRLDPVNPGVTWIYF
jgi:dsDNA-specific endonuclease/ATPase MutS2